MYEVLGARMTAPISRGEPYIRAYSGRRIYLRHPSLNERLHLEDFAHGLARIARFTGQTAYPYSVASHCLMVADLLPRERRASGLMHDAIEAVLGDVSSPLKSLLPGYRALQDLWTREMARRWGCDLEGPELKVADRLAYAIERRDLCPYGDTAQGWDIETEIRIPMGSVVHCSQYAGDPRAVAAMWLSDARLAGIPEVA